MGSLILLQPKSSIAIEMWVWSDKVIGILLGPKSFNLEKGIL